MNCLVTGASGMIGGAIVEKLRQEQAVSVLVRDDGYVGKPNVSVGFLELENYDQLAPKVFQDIDTVIHCAAMIPGRIKSKGKDYSKINTEASCFLARKAAEMGVRRFVFLSSVGVHGIEADETLTESSPVNPRDAYSESKLAAELALIQLAQTSKIEVVIIRPPAVCGSNVDGSISQLAKLVWWGVPFPFNDSRNLRSFVSLDNLVDFILLCADHERVSATTHEIFLIADETDLSTSDLLKLIGFSFGKKIRTIGVPISILKFGLTLIGLDKFRARLFGNLRVDASKAKHISGWEPITSIQNQLGKMSINAGKEAP